MELTRATLAALCVVLVLHTTEARAGGGGQGHVEPRSGIVGRSPVPGNIPSGRPRSYPGFRYPGDQGWIDVPGRDAGYDRWRRDAERAYRRGDFFIQGWQPRPYRHAHPGYGHYPPVPYPYAWPR